MANRSDHTRKEQVLLYLQAHKDDWVDGVDLAHAAIGGSEGLRRVRDLRAEGHRIERRRHPDPARDIYQYRLVDRAAVSPLREDRPGPPVDPQRDEAAGGSGGTVPLDAVVPIGRPETELSYAKSPSKIEFGSTATCPKCHGRGLQPGTKVDQEKPCKRCGGKGIVPNIGVVPWA